MIWSGSIKRIWVMSVSNDTGFTRMDVETGRKGDTG